MPLTPKISRLQRIPELLKYKREEEEERKRRRGREQKKQPGQFIEDEVSISLESKAQLEVKMAPNPKAFEAPQKTKDDGVGENLDLRI